MRFGNNRSKIYVLLCWDYKSYCWLNCLYSSVVSKGPECFPQHSHQTLAERQVPVLHACADIYICRQGWRMFESSRSRRGIPRWIYHVSQLLHHTLHHLRLVLEQLRWELLIQPSLTVTHRSTVKHIVVGTLLKVSEILFMVYNVFATLNWAHNSEYSY